MQTSTKKEVSCKALDTIFGYAKSKNIELDSLIVGVPYELVYLLNRRERIEWWVWCKIISNSRNYFQLNEYEEMGRSFVSRGSYWEGILWSFFLFTSSKLTKLLYSQIFKLAASTFSCIVHRTDFKKANGFTTTASMEDGYDFSTEWALMCKGVWEQLGTNIGQKDFKVDVTITNNKVIFDVSWRKENLLFKVKKGMIWFFNIRKALLEITESRDALLNQYQELETSQKKLQKQTTQLKTAYEISTSVHQSVNINDTLKAIADALVNEAGFSAVFIQLDKDIEDKDIDVRWQTGAITKLNNPLCQEIIISEKKIGNYIVNPNENSKYNENKEFIEYLTPVINVAIHDALVLRAIVDYRDNLEQKVLDRTCELQKARDELFTTNQLLKDAQRIQNQFFTNISHEFRTPLTLIIGPSRQLSEEMVDEEKKAKVDLIHRSANKLNRLVDELLDISKIESGEMKLKACAVNIVSAVNEIAYSFFVLAERKKICFNIKSCKDKITVYLDKNKVDKILTNVLSNAFKFTPEGGKIEISIKPAPSVPLPGWDLEVSAANDFVEISIQDTGTGIPQNQIEKIFDRFYQVDSGITREHEGTGIGLALTKELVELHKGRIKVESEEGRGTTIRIYFRLGKEHLKPEEVSEDEDDKRTQNDKLISSIEDFNEEIRKDISAGEFYEMETLPYLLIVEDNSDVRKYITSILENIYKVIEAKDGEDGISKAFECIPDLIITDIMMPKMDGFQFCGKLKTDSRTSHIPVIMLTAKATIQDKIIGLEIGADDYIMKPFEEAELKARIKNLLEQRKRLHDHFRQFGLVELDKKNITSIDQKFLQSAFEIINKHLSETDFGVEELADNMAISRSLLFKKVNALIGESPNEFIKRTRLSKAARLILKNHGNISEIALEVGFSNPSYFAECFKKQFGVAPSHYHIKS